jgi:hypothetical protein
MNALTINSDQLRRAADIKAQIEALESQLSAILNGGSTGTAPAPSNNGPVAAKRQISAAGKARIAAAARARWARQRGQAPAKSSPPMGKKTLSPAAKARIAAAARRRWAAARAAGRNAL